MRSVGLITGASSGIGRALAYEHARRGRDLIVVARRADALEKLADDLRSRYGVQVEVLAHDLTEAGSRRQLYHEVTSRDIAVEYVFNNAGFGENTEFVAQDWASVARMIELNVTAATELLHLFLPAMLARGRGRILNTSSTAGYMPGPLQAVYFATKAFLNSLSKAVAAELSGSGVTVTLLCPGPVDTEFADRAGFNASSPLMEQAVSAESVARQGYTAMEAGRLEVINDLKLQLAVKGLLPLVPDRLAMAVIRKAQS